MRDAPRERLVDALRAGGAGGLAMIPFAAVFRARGLRVNEYGRKTLALLVGDVAGASGLVLTFLQHMAISVAAALPLVWLLRRVAGRGARVAFGAAYGAGFYVAMNSLALPFAFGDPTPWQLGAEVVAPSLVIHLVYGAVVGALARSAPGGAAAGAEAAGG